MEMTNRKKGVIAAVSAGVLIAVTGGVFAYFAAKDGKANLVRVGEDTISVDESFDQPEQKKDFAYRKLVKIDNTGSVPCFVRVRLEFSDSAVQSAAWFSSDKQDADDSVTYNDTDVYFSPADPADDNAYAKHLPDGWEYSPDGVTEGYYYYTAPVAAGESTSALISWVKMAYGDETEIQAHDIYVYAESVQTVDPDTGEDYADPTLTDGYKTAWRNFTN